LPETLKNFGSETFMNCEKLENINLPNTLERIGGLAFGGCDALKAFKIPANVSSVGMGAFAYCVNLAMLDIDESNSNFCVIDGVLFNKDKTKIISFPCGYKSRHYTVPDGVKVIGDTSFSGAKIETITFPLSLEIIEDSAFRDCSKMKIFDVPDTVMEIGHSAFEGCCNVNKIHLPNQLKILRFLSLAGCDKLKEFEMPASVKTVETGALTWTRNLEILVLHNGLEELNDSLQFSNIRELYIPKTVRKIGSGLAILGSKRTKTQLIVDEENPFFCAVDNSLYSRDETILIAACPNNRKIFVVPDGVRKIEALVFARLDFEQIISL
jgi:hypothetical protein